MDDISSSPASLALLPSEDAPGTRELLDLGFQLGQEAGALGGTLQPPVRAAVGDLVRSMNCYYSNLIEGHDTLPRDIDRALRSDYETDPRRRDLQLEARAHIEVQAMVDRGDLDGLGVGADLVVALHREFCTRLPDALLWVESRDRQRRLHVEPGRWREVEVDVGRHVPVAPDMIPAFMEHFGHGYALERVGRARGAIAAAASHHRLLWIHPFLDGNGRVARLYSHAYLRLLGIGSDLWSVSRGLARTVARYMAALERADFPPQTMTDGRGTLSERELGEFCRYFLEIALDQVRFMRGLLDPVQLVNRLQTFVIVEAQRKALDQKVFAVLARIATAGELPKSDLPAVLGVTARHALRLVQPLIDRGLLVSQGKFAPYRLAFPLTEVEMIFPRLFAPTDG